MGIMDDPDWPRDEYECLVGPLLRRLGKGDDAEAIGRFLAGELEEHFGIAAPPHRPHAFAERVIAWYQERWPGTGSLPAGG